MITVGNIIGNSGNAVVNQFVLTDFHSKDEIIFQSYDSLICTVSDETMTITFYPNWNYSATTAKYLYIFLKDYAGCYDLGNRKAIIKALKDGFYKDYKVELATVQIYH